VNTYRLSVKVIPGAQQTAFVGELGDAIKIRLKAPPEKGKANAELVDFLAKKLGVEKSCIRLCSGATSRTKTLEISSEKALNIGKALGY